MDGISKVNNVAVKYLIRLHCTYRKCVLDTAVIKPQSKAVVSGHSSLAFEWHFDYYDRQVFVGLFSSEGNGSQYRWRLKKVRLRSQLIPIGLMRTERTNGDDIHCLWDSRRRDAPDSH